LIYGGGVIVIRYRVIQVDGGSMIALTLLVYHEVVIIIFLCGCIGTGRSYERRMITAVPLYDAEIIAVAFVQQYRFMIASSILANEDIIAVTNLIYVDAASVGWSRHQQYR